MNLKTKLSILISAAALYSTGALATQTTMPNKAPEITVEMVDLSNNKKIGTVTASQSAYGVVFTPKLKIDGIKHGALHGFHVHVNPSCAPSMKDGKQVIGGAAGGHYDPENTKKHGFPWTADNHLGDLPALYIDQNGNATSPVLAPRLKVEDLEGRSLMVHIGGDNYSDHPKPLGGGGHRMLCGVFK